MPPRSALEDFLFAEAALLDGGAFGAWLDLFTPDGIYWVPASPNQTDAENEISLFHENVALMRMRIERLGHPRAHGVALPIRTSRIVGNVVAGGIDDGAIVVRSRFQLVEFQDRRQRLFAGAYTHRLVPEGGSFRIRQKRVDLVNVEGWHEAMQVFL
ncbi:MAG: aromatic-ring-hydroxylating dioxygenase subunit beta [Rhodospirillaceae bacterium]|nr:aromatic-ring-hydroxylating dioxygenase subunit beta [Rhodospirillaceae bacterium]